MNPRCENCAHGPLKDECRAPLPHYMRGRYNQCCSQWKKHNMLWRDLAPIVNALKKLKIQVI